MKAITLWQPWASLIAWGEKQYETRNWATNYRGPLAIHASLRFTSEEKTICWQPVFAQALIRHGLEKPSDLQLGAVLCLVDLVDVVRVGTFHRNFSQQEQQFGNYAAGRFAWKLENVRVLQDPIKTRGYQGLWEWQMNPKSLKFFATGGVVHEKVHLVGETSL